MAPRVEGLNPLADFLLNEECIVIEELIQIGKPPTELDINFYHSNFKTFSENSKDALAKNNKFIKNPNQISNNEKINVNIQSRNQKETISSYSLERYKYITLLS